MASTERASESRFELPPLPVTPQEPIGVMGEHHVEDISRTAPENLKHLAEKVPHDPDFPGSGEKVSPLEVMRYQTMPELIFPEEQVEKPRPPEFEDQPALEEEFDLGALSEMGPTRIGEKDPSGPSCEDLLSATEQSSLTDEEIAETKKKVAETDEEIAETSVHKGEESIQSLNISLDDLLEDLKALAPKSGISEARIDYMCTAGRELLERFSETGDTNLLNNDLENLRELLSPEEFKLLIDFTQQSLKKYQIDFYFQPSKGALDEKRAEKKQVLHGKFQSSQKTAPRSFESRGKDIEKGLPQKTGKGSLREEKKGTESEQAKIEYLRKSQRTVDTKVLKIQRKKIEKERQIFKDELKKEVAAEDVFRDQAQSDIQKKIK
jgi:hypothetical protein